MLTTFCNTLMLRQNLLDRSLVSIRLLRAIQILSRKDGQIPIGHWLPGRDRRRFEQLRWYLGLNRDILNLRLAHPCGQE